SNKVVGSSARMRIGSITSTAAIASICLSARKGVRGVIGKVGELKARQGCIDKLIATLLRHLETSQGKRHVIANIGHHDLVFCIREDKPDLLAKFLGMFCNIETVD